MRRTGIRVGLAALVVLIQALGSVAVAGAKIAADDTKWLSIGIGVRSSFSAVEDAAPNGTSWSKDFDVDNARIYLNGQIHEYVKFELNTECVFCANPKLRDYTILDAIVKFVLSPAFNIWAGRLLVPSDRAEMSGPYYANTYDFNKTPFYPSDYSTKFGDGGAGVYGRDHGITFWGGLGDEARFTYAVGVFNGYEGGSNQDDDLLYGIRLSYNFLAVEQNPGYYTSSTYYGDAGDVFTFAVAAQTQDNGAGTKMDPADFSGYSVDVLYEKLLGGGGVVTVEAEYKVFDTGLNKAALADGAKKEGATCFCLFDGDSWTATALYLFPKKMGIGKLQPYLRYTSVSPDNSTERDEWGIGLNYIISGHNARVSVMYQHGDIRTKGLGYVPGVTGDEVAAFKIAVQFQY